MPGVEPEDITVEVTEDSRLVLHADLRATLKQDKEVLAEEWNAGPYHRELQPANPVNAELANVTYGNGVVVTKLPLAERTTPARLTLQTTGNAHGEHIASHGRTVEPVTAEEHHSRGAGPQAGRQ